VAELEREITMRMMALVTMLALAPACAQDEKNFNSYKGKAPPELASEKEHWINSAEALSLEKLKGKVVWLEYSFIN
jgi:hypothetical protein